MKHTISKFLLIVAILFVLPGCGELPNSSNVGSTNPSSPTSGVTGTTGVAPTKPAPVNSWRLPLNPDVPPGYVQFDATISGKIAGKDYLFLGTNNNGGLTQTGVSIVDLTDPINPHQISFTNAPQAGMRIHSLTLDGTTLYVSAESALWILDVADPTAPKSILLSSSYQALTVAVNGKYAYVSEVPTTKIIVLDVSEPAHPVPVGTVILIAPQATLPPGVITGGYPIQYYGIQVLRISGSLLFALVYQTNAGMPQGNGLFILDISSPTTPKQLTYFPNPGAPLTVIAPGLGGTFTEPSVYQGMAVLGNYAYMAANGPDGMQVLDISNPAHPRLIANVPGYGANEITVVGSRAYLHYGGWFQIVDITDPVHPQPIAKWGPENPPSTFTIAGDYIYLMIRGDKSNPIYLRN